MRKMAESKLKLLLLPETLVICRLDKDAPIPEWALKGVFFSVTRTREELSVVCPQIHAPAEIEREEGWRCIKAQGPLDFSLTGILASLTLPLARAGISVFAISTYDTDYLLVKEENLEKAVEILIKSGHRVQKNSSE